MVHNKFKITEDFLQAVWRYKLLELHNLHTNEGETLHIISMGVHNHNAGPDFLNGRIRLGHTIWAGNIEIHIKSSDWIRHKHDEDDAYQNVILHVVFENDAITFNNKGERIPTLEIASRIKPNIDRNYYALQKNRSSIPCSKFLRGIEQLNVENWLDRLVLERLEQKTNAIRSVYEFHSQDWESTLLESLAHNFGFQVNNLPFEQLARSISFKTLKKHRYNRFHLEALLFGQSSLLRKNLKDSYPVKLKAEYLFFQKKYGLSPIKMSSWKFLRLRPTNFPTIRIAQFAGLISKDSFSFSSVLDCNSLPDLLNLLETETAIYWDTHYVFDKKSDHVEKTLGITAKQSLIINAVIPVLFFYGKMKDDKILCQRMVDMLEVIPMENNKILREWDKMGIKSKTAAQSQALLQLKKHYCDQMRCLHCAFGIKILSGEN